MNTYERTLHFGDEALLPVTQDADLVLQRLLKNMVEKGGTDGSLTIKIDVEMVQDVVQNFDPNIDGEARNILRPEFSHKVSSTMQIKDESKGNMKCDGQELVWDETVNEYVLKPVIQAQQTIFDADYTVTADQSNGSNTPALGEKAVLTLPEAASGDEVSEGEQGKKSAACGVAEGADAPFKYLLQFVGEEMRVMEAMGNFTVRTKDNRVILSSAVHPADRFYCSAEALKPYVGETVVCVGEPSTIPGDNSEYESIIIWCEKFDAVLFRIDADESQDHEDLSDDFGGYEYEPSEF